MRIRPRPSRTLFLWWGAVHALAAAGVLASALPHPVAALVLVALLVHSRRGRPKLAAPLDLRASGRWARADTGAEGLVLAEGTAVGPFWIKLVLEAPRGAVESAVDSVVEAAVDSVVEGAVEDAVEGAVEDAVESGANRSPRNGGVDRKRTGRRRPLRGRRAGTRIACLLLRDQLDRDTWRALQAELRRGARSDAH